MRPLNRIKKQKREFTTEHFYILRTQYNHWLFIDRKSHKVISSTPYLEVLKESISSVLNRYKHYDHYLKVMSKNDFSLPVPEKEYARRVLLEKKEGHVYDYIIEEILADLQRSKDVETQRLRRVEEAVKTRKPAVEIPPVIVPKRLVRKKPSRL